MKKFYYLLAALLVAISSPAYSKNSAYVGFDLNKSRLTHGFMDNQLESVIVRDKSTSFSVDLGYNFDLGERFFVAPEIFYDKIDSSVMSGSSIKVLSKVNSRYGAKLNLGHNIDSKINVFVNAGITNVNMNQINIYYDQMIIGSADYNKKSAFLYGVGAAYNLSEKVALRLSYDRSNFKVKSAVGLSRNDVEISLFKLGVVYKF